MISQLIKFSTTNQMLKYCQSHMMDVHNPLRQPPRPNKGRIDVETIPLRHHLNPLDEERACRFIHDRHTLQDRHKSLYRWSTDGPLINISGKHYK